MLFVLLFDVSEKFKLGPIHVATIINQFNITSLAMCACTQNHRLYRTTLPMTETKEF